MIVGGYTLELYCDNESVHPKGWLDAKSNQKAFGEFTADVANSYSKARKAAKKAGWVLRRDGTCVCPYCVHKSSKSIISDNVVKK